MSVGLLMFSQAPSWPLLVASHAVIGLSIGVVDVSVNTYVATHHGVGAMNLLHAGYGVGAVGGPLLVTAAILSGGSWRLSYLALGALELVLLVTLVLHRAVWQDSAPSALPGPHSKRQPARRWWALGLTIALFFAYTGVELSAGQWTYSSLTLAHGVNRALAGILVAGFWLGLLAGRVGAASVGHRATPRRLLDLSFGGAVLGAGLFTWYPSLLVGTAGLILLGLALAAIFPTLVSLTGARVGDALAPAAVGYQLAAGAVGGTVLPAMAGVVLQATGVAFLGHLLLAGTAVMIAVHAIILRVVRPR